MFYVSSSVRDMFLSYDTLFNLGILANDFPYSQWVTDPQTSNIITAPSISATRSVNHGCCSCSCRQREAAPPCPSQLPFPCTPENNEYTCPNVHYPPRKAHLSRYTSTRTRLPRHATLLLAPNASSVYMRPSSVMKHLVSSNVYHM